MRRYPVLIVTWRRPSELQACIEAVAALRPSALYIAQDGPNFGSGCSSEGFYGVRRVVESSHFQFPVHTKFSKSHLGLRRGVISAIDWFFQNETEGIVLEEDILPSKAFFDLVEVQLDTYRSNRSVSQISGTNHSDGLAKFDDHFYFSRFQHVWGFATWRDRWTDFPGFLNTAEVTREHVERAFPGFHAGFYAHWTKRIRAELSGQSDTWTASWNYYCGLLRRFSLVPPATVVENIGFGPLATNAQRIPLIAGAPPACGPEKITPNFSAPVHLNPVRDRYVAITLWPTQRVLQRIRLALIELLKRVFENLQTMVHRPQADKVAAPNRPTIAQAYFKERVLAHYSWTPDQSNTGLDRRALTDGSNDGPRHLPVLILGWQRPDMVFMQLCRLRKAGIKKVYVHADGPRSDHWLDKWTCSETRAVLESFRDDFDLQLFYEENNVGLQRSVLRGVDWFFQNETSGLILEDDIDISDQLLDFVSLGLCYFENDDTVAQIASGPQVRGIPPSEEAAYLSRFHHIWGFATWKRAWSGFPEFYEEFQSLSLADLRRALPGFWGGFYRHWVKRASGRSRAHAEVEWDTLWNIFNFLRGSKSVSPQASMAQNNGFDATATHSNRVPLIAGPPPLKTPSIVDPAAMHRLKTSLTRDTYVASTAWATRGMLPRALTASLEWARRKGGQHKTAQRFSNPGYVTIAQLFERWRIFGGRLSFK